MQLKIILQKIPIKKEIIIELLFFILKISGWFSFLFLVFDNSPNISGVILGVSIGKTEERGPHTIYTIYPYITNSSITDFELIDFTLEIDLGKGYLPLEKNLIQNDINDFAFLDENGREILIQNFPQKIIYNKSMLATFGIPIHGFLSFKGPPEYYDIIEKSYKLTCIDVTGKKYEIISDTSKMNYLLFKEISGVREFEDYSITK